MKRVRLRLEFYPCSHCGHICNNNKDDIESGVWCNESDIARDWICGKCQIGKCRVKGILDRVELEN